MLNGCVTIGVRATYQFVVLNLTFLKYSIKILNNWVLFLENYKFIGGHICAECLVIA